MMAEAFARSFEVPVVTLRPFNTYGPRQSERAIIPTIIRQALDPNCAAILVGDTTPVRDLTFVEDTAAAFIAAGTTPGLEFGRPYNAGNGTSVTVGDLIDLIVATTEWTNRSYPIRSASGRRIRKCGHCSPTAAVSRLRRAGRPQVPLREGLQRTIDWWRHRLERGLVRREKAFMI